MIKKVIIYILFLRNKNRKNNFYCPLENIKKVKYITNLLKPDVIINIATEANFQKKTKNMYRVNVLVPKILVSIAKKIGLQGSINIQLKRSSRRAAIFEINPRISGTVMMRHMLRFNDLIWWIKHLLYKKLPRKINIKN